MQRPRQVDVWLTVARPSPHECVHEWGRPQWWPDRVEGLRCGHRQTSQDALTMNRPGHLGHALYSIFWMDPSKRGSTLEGGSRLGHVSGSDSVRRLGHGVLDSVTDSVRRLGRGLRAYTWSTENSIGSPTVDAVTLSQDLKQ